MAYNKTNWVSGVTLLSAENFNKIEKGIEDAHTTASNIQNTLNNVTDDVTNIKTSISTLASNIENLKQSVNTLADKVEELLNQPEPPLEDDLPDVLPKLNTPIISLEEVSNTSSILGEAMLGYAVLGTTGGLINKLDTPAIKVITKLDTPVIKLIEGNQKLSTPIIRLEQDVITKLKTPTIELVNIILKLATPVIDIMEV